MKIAAGISKKLGLLGVCAVLCAAPILNAQTSGTVEVQIKADQVLFPVSPALYGLMTEEINHSYDGGLYAELIRNRNFKEDPNNAVDWSLVQEHGGAGSMALDPSTPFNDAIGTSLKLTVTTASGNQRVGIANDGYWGIAARPSTTYHASFYAKAAAGFTGPLTISLTSADAATVLATAQVPSVSTSWNKYEATMTTGKVTASANNHFAITAGHAGTIWFSMVSLFPPTFANRANGNRQDIMQLLADMKPSFLRFPGGNYLEGNSLPTRFDWKTTIGDVSKRPGHMDDAWRYWSSDGMGLLDFLDWCEDLRMQPVLAVFAGYTLRNGTHASAGQELVPYVNDALDEIEYVTGDATTKWGTQRVKDGHPAPFSLEYVEVGNEDNFDRAPGGYEARYAQFFDAIKAKYPHLKVIATAPITTRAADVIDEHYYRRSYDEMAAHSNDYDTRPRGAQKVFVGEWATRVGGPTPDMGDGLADAAWLVGLERNSDLVVMASYAPLFVNVNKDALQWQPDLIGYDAMSSYGSPSYYVQQMFSNHHGDNVISLSAHNVPSKEWQPIGAGGRGNGPQRMPMVSQVPQMFFDATRDSKTGTIYIKAVNRDSVPHDVHVVISGVGSVDPSGQALLLSGNSPTDTNSITQPTNIVAHAVSVDGLGMDFTKTAPPYSVSVLELQAK
ncbi:MAG TPA: alpha-L-arabinofuranosidase C-terminal domain-containing protein [Candidatus Acidoferrum sp.]|nr:alpha-L-arabinofuranosidase C-terminal domain-containing protein [Candidatus Acidoferrum sp.]